MIKEDVKEEMNTKEDDIEHSNLAISTELQAPATTRLLKKTSILELEHSNETRPEFFAFMIKFHNFIRDTYHIWELEGCHKPRRVCHMSHTSHFCDRF